MDRLKILNLSEIIITYLNDTRNFYNNILHKTKIDLQNLINNSYIMQLELLESELPFILKNNN
jgi:hypothetical protein